MAALSPEAATVIEIGSGWCTVQTDSGQTLRVSASGGWSVGSRVLVLAGAVIGPAGPARSTQVFDV